MKPNPTPSTSSPIVGNSYTALPNGFFETARPSPAPAAKVIILNHGLLSANGIDPHWFETSAARDMFSGNQVDAAHPPIAMAYSGHQFGGWSPLLGDGRAHMLGQVIGADGQVLDIQLKGSGPSRYSRGGDGKATLASVLREYLVSEAMAGLGIPSTRALSVIATGETVYRDRALPGAILVRTASSHIRVGSFQHAAANIGPEGVRALADHMLDHHFHALQNMPNPYVALFEAVVARQARLVAQWMAMGFIHGVMNTDNMSIIGETIDFGPCAFMDEFRADKVFSSIDQNGRYAWNRQPEMAQWNLTRLAETLLPLFADTEEAAVAVAQGVLDGFSAQFDAAFWTGFAAKIGHAADTPQGRVLIQKLFDLLGRNEVDFTLFFDALTDHVAGADEGGVTQLFVDQAEIAAWLAQWREGQGVDSDSMAVMRRANPVIIARNHSVERALADATDRADFALFFRLAAALANPFQLSADNEDLRTPPRADERVQATFCGT
jgi:serine/tyrosine/threonine adenylyltransferase